jgi:pimeloyl-ACP methyl ester carboxylesterase
MRVFHCTRAVLLALAAAGALAAGHGDAWAQSPATSNFSIYVRSAPIGTEQVTVAQGADGWTITSAGRVAAPIDLAIRQFRARYDAEWRPLELTVDATLRGQATIVKTTVSGTTATTQLSGAAGTAERTDTINEHAIFMPSPFIAPYEAVAARARTATAGTTLFLYQPGQGSFTALVGASATERIQTVERVITARRTAITFQAASQPPVDGEIWGDEAGRLLRLRIPSQSLEVAREDMAAVSTRSVTSARPNDLDVRIPANGFSLAGTLSRPEGSSTAPLPAVILVAGSGPTDRDEKVAGIPIFGQLANALADAGFMVLRYDKRGVGQSGGRPESAALADYVEDVRAAIRMMGERKDVDRRRIALVGHSEGGSLALLAASKTDRVAAVALLGTIGGTGAELNLYQVTHAAERSNRPEAERAATIDLQRRIQAAVLTGKGWDDLELPDAVRRQAETPYFQSLLAFDTSKVMKDVSQPLLIVQGALDKQVPPDSADRLEALAKARKKSPPVEVVKVPGVNHLLVPAQTGEVDEYGTLGSAQVSPEVANALTSWLKKTLAERR